MKSFKEYIVESTYKILSHSDLTKRGGDRLDTFISKVKNQEPFLTTAGNVVLNQKEFSGFIDDFKKSGFSADLSAILSATGAPVKVKYPKDFYKTPDFGGKGVGFGTKAEDAYLASFQKEMQQVMENEKIFGIDLLLGKRLVRDIVRIESTPGTPKADFHFIDKDEKEVGWISHKAGKSAKDFQQYGGITHPVLFQSKDVQKFIDDLMAIKPDGLSKGESFWREIKDNTLIRKSVWGVDWGGKRGRNNVDEFHQGVMKLSKQKNVWVITSSHYLINSEIPDGAYDAYLMARYTSERDAFGLQNVRIGVFPKGQKPSTGKII